MKRSRLMILLVVLLCAALVYAWMATPRQRRVSAPATGRIQTSTSIEQSLSAVAEFEELDFTGSAASAYRKPVRNLFAALYQPPKVLPKPKKKPRPRPKPVPKADVRTSVVKSLQPTGPPPMKPLQFLGHMRKSGRMTVFLASDGGKIFLVGEGDRFGDGLELAAVSEKDVVVKKIATGQEVKMLVKTTKGQRIPRINFKSGRPSAAIPTQKPSQSDEQNK